MEKFVKSYQIRSYECDKHRQLRLLTLMNILQDMADTHADRLGLGYDFCRSKKLAWVAGAYHIKIERMPQLHEQIEVTTWPSEELKLAAIRDYEIKDAQGKILVSASTQWVLINFETKRPVALRGNLPCYEIVTQKADNFSFGKIALPENFDICKKFEVRFDDIDVNNHVNNAVYPLWASEAADNDFRLSHNLKEVEIYFKKPALYGDTVLSKASFEGKTSWHKIESEDETKELARARLVWEKV